MNTFFPTNSKIDLNTSDYSSNYKIPLHKVLPIIEGNAFHSSNMYQLINFRNPHISPDFYEEIYAIIPIQQHCFKRTIVLYESYFMYVEMTSSQISKQILTTSPLLNFNAYTKTLQHLFNKKTTIIPVATNSFSLIPLGPVKSPETIWINPGQVTDLRSYDLKTLLMMENQISICSDRLIKGISKRMLKGFLAHGILKREDDTQAIRPSTLLLEYLGLPSTPAIRKILRYIQFQELPYLQGDFVFYYTQIYNQLLKQNLLDDLDIEE